MPKFQKPVLVSLEKASTASTPSSRSSRSTRKPSANELIRKRVARWEDEDPSSLLTRQIEKATTPLHGLISLLLPDTLVREGLEKTLWAAEALTDRAASLKELGVASLDEAARLKADVSDQGADKVQFWAVGTAAALGAWDVCGPLGLAPALASIFTLAFRTIKKIGVCHGFDTSSHFEELVALQILVAASSLYHRDKVQALKTIEKLVATHGANPATVTRENVLEAIEKVSHVVTTSLIKRRSLASVPAMGALIGGSSNAWLLQDVSWAARNVYASRKFRLQSDERAKARSKREAERQTEGGGLPQAA